MQGRAPCLRPVAASRLRRLSRTEGYGDRRSGASPPSTPTDIRTRLQSSLSLTLGPGTISLVAAKRSRRDGACAENNCKEDCEDLRHRRPQGRLQVASEGFSPSGFPPSRSGHCPICIYSHTHCRWGLIGGRGSTADRGRRGGSLSQSLGGTSTYTGTMRRRCATLSHIA